jgi:hypothetical protein
VICGIAGLHEVVYYERDLVPTPSLDDT